MTTTKSKTSVLMMARNFIIFISLTLFAQQGLAQSKAHGTVNKQGTNSESVWNAETNKWVSFDDFWQHVASANNTKHWGQSSVYPEYEKVQEFDTFLVEVPQGTCLMQFFHSRWRRANDVQRWNPAFNCSSSDLI